MTEKFTCENCGKSLSKSGYYKHIKKCGIEETKTGVEIDRSSMFADEEMSPSPQGQSMADEDSPPPTFDEPEWGDFTINETDITEHIPTPLQAVLIANPVQKLDKKGKPIKLSKKEMQAIEEQNLALLKSGLTGIDYLTTYYGRAVMVDEDYSCKHSDKSKSIVAHAQYAWMREKGIDITDYVNRGMIASILTAGYILPPIIKIQKKSKVKVLRAVARKIPNPFRWLRDKLRRKRQKTILSNGGLKHEE